MRTCSPLTMSVTLALCGVAMLAVVGAGQPPDTESSSSAAIPRTWDEKAIASMTVPLADPHVSPQPVSSDHYYRMPVRPIYKSYPVYAANREPAGYMEWLKQQEPQIAFDASKRKTRADWIKAGELVFDAPAPGPFGFPLAYVRSPVFYGSAQMPVVKDGTIPFVRYVVRRKGEVEVASFSCAMCHTRVVPDGSVIKGAQGNFPFERYSVPPGSTEQERVFERLLFDAPWVRPDPLAQIKTMSYDQIVAAHAAIPPGVMARHGTNTFCPVKVPDLVGVKDRRYLDSTGLVRHRGIGDLMRYAAMNQVGDLLTRYGDFIPAGIEFHRLPEPTNPKSGRYSDAQLYALSLYLYSLKPPPNPNRFDALSARGQRIFRREGCGSCHTPPLYTNNMLTPAEGFAPPPAASRDDQILPVCVGTDASLALTTRRGTGYYKVPSLKGVWYRGMFGHGGWCATLEDWFDPRRTRDDYIPTGNRGYPAKARAVTGHLFGLNLSAADRQALIAFLRTL